MNRQAETNHTGAGSVNSEEAIVKLAGGLQGEWVGELRRCWQGIREVAAPASIRVELADIQFIDAAGEGSPQGDAPRWCRNHRAWLSGQRDLRGYRDRFCTQSEPLARHVTLMARMFTMNFAAFGMPTEERSKHLGLTLRSPAPLFQTWEVRRYPRCGGAVVGEYLRSRANCSRRARFAKIPVRRGR